ncbi:hypothetical protein KSP39_PZI002260 [Platanthera zijinensis]|uniref:TsaA-like domain-containing protein n=1 Tax=Platanthera zijinensis TaxID=2320716 RepID=A0AAP0BZA6_9ASPA
MLSGILIIKFRILDPAITALMTTTTLSELTKLLAAAFTITTAVTALISLTFAFFSVSICRRRWRLLSSRIQELEASLEVSLEKAASERRGRVRAQQDLRKALVQQSSDIPRIMGPGSPASYPMSPIGLVKSCFATRNGTPRQPLLVPHSRACLAFDSSRVQADALDGLTEYSHCWVLFVFHLNTDLEKLWKQPSRSKFKAKVRVPRLEGGKRGVLATRSPHRPCPIGLSVAKIEALEGHALMLSGVDLVDGTPVLDVKPYLPYSDSIQGATIPNWFTEKISLYASMDAFQSLIKEVLSCDIRSLSQRSSPHHVIIEGGNHRCSLHPSEKSGSGPTNVIYHLILEGVDISYRIDERSNVMVEKATLVSCESLPDKDCYKRLPRRENVVKKCFNIECLSRYEN